MHRRYFPACPIDGPIEPAVPFRHMACDGSVPFKCSTCECLFEGECLRFYHECHRYMHLDYGPCGVEGATDPVACIDVGSRVNAEVPRKCSTCEYLVFDSISEFSCSKDAHIWGDRYRGLDWGDWKPDFIELSLPLPKISTRELSMAAVNDDLMAFVKEHRRINPGCSIQEAREDFVQFREVLERVRL